MTSPTNNNSLDDIFGSSPPHDPAPHTTTTTTLHHESTTTTKGNAPEPSELPSLRRQHVTAGYRDGIAASKGEHVQAGFDAGFPVGAQLGLRAGTALGILEGILRGYESRAMVKKQPVRSTQASGTGAATSTVTSTSNGEGTADGDASERQAKKEEILKLYRQAVADLDLQAVFSGLHGVEGEKPEAQLARLGEVAVSKWEKRVKVAHWEENMEALEMKDGGLGVKGQDDVAERS